MFAALLAAGCAQTPPVQREELTQFKRIGAVSVIGDTLTRQYLGLTVFGNESDERNVSEWDLDRVYAGQIGEAARLSGTG